MGAGYYSDFNSIMNSIQLKLLAVAAAACLSFAASAQGVQGYVGLGGGFAGSNVKNSNNSESKYETASAAQIFGGVRFNQNVALEAEYLSTGDIRLTNGKVKTSGYGLSAIVGAPVGNWAFFGKIGVTSLTSKLSADPGYVLIVKDSETKTGVVIGGGAEYAFTPNAALRLAISSYDMSAGDGAVSGRLSTYTVAGVFSF